MKIVFHGNHTAEEAAESMSGILELFRERYGISNFNDMTLQVCLLNQEEEPVEIIDAITSEVFDVFEVVKSADAMPQPSLKLVVDNTRS